MSRNTKKIIVILASTLILAIALVSLGISYAGGVRGVGLVGVCFFFTGGVVVVLAQLIPASILISLFIGKACSSFRKGEMSIRAT